MIILESLRPMLWMGLSASVPAALQPFGDRPGPLDQFSSSQIVLIIVIAIVVGIASLVFWIWGLVRLFGGEHYVLGVLALFIPLMSVVGLFVSPRPGSSLDRKRRARLAAKAASVPGRQADRSKVANVADGGANWDMPPLGGASSASSEHTMRPNGADTPGAGATREMVLPPPPRPLSHSSPHPVDTVPRRRGAGWLLAMAVLVWAVVGVWIVFGQPEALEEVSIQADELVERAVRANAAWDEVEGELLAEAEAGDTASAERRDQLFRETDRLLEAIHIDTAALLAQAVGLAPATEIMRHAVVVEHLEEMVISATDMIEGLHQPPGVKELRLAGLRGLKMAAAAISDVTG